MNSFPSTGRADLSIPNNTQVLGCNKSISRCTEVGRGGTVYTFISVSRKLALRYCSPAISA